MGLGEVKSGWRRGPRLPWSQTNLQARFTLFSLADNSHMLLVCQAGADGQNKSDIVTVKGGGVNRGPAAPYCPRAHYEFNPVILRNLELNVGGDCLDCLSTVHTATVNSQGCRGEKEKRERNFSISFQIFFLFSFFCCLAENELTLTLIIISSTFLAFSSSCILSTDSIMIIELVLESNYRKV